MSNWSANDVAAANPNIKVAHLAGAGHNIRREQFEAFVEVVSGFLREAIQ